MSHAATLRFDSAPSALVYMGRALWPSRRSLVVPPRLEAYWSGHRAEPGRLASFLSITGLPDASTLPLLYPHSAGFRLTMSLVTHPAFPVPIWRLLQVRNHLLQHRPIPRGASMDFCARASAGRIVAKGLELDVHTTVQVAGELTWESVVTFYARGDFGAPGRASPLARSPEVPAPLLARWATRDEGHWRFGRITGDYNGIHHWDWYARKLGFRRALYRPQHVLGQCLARLPSLGADGRGRLDVWVKGPVLHGSTVRLHGASHGGATTFALFDQPERPSIVGRLARVGGDARLVDAQGQVV